MAQTPGWLVAAVIGRARGLRGEVHLAMRTDRVAGRFAPGTRFETEPPEAGPLTLLTLNASAGTYLARFEEAGDREAAEELRGVELLVEPDQEDDAWYPSELRGLPAVLPDGAPYGLIEDVEFGAAQDLLVIALASGGQVRLPLVAQFVPEVDVAGGRVVVDPPEGLE